MTLEILKNQIESNLPTEDLIIFCCESADSRYIASQYLAEIARIKGASISYVNSLSEITSNALDLVFNYELTLKVFYTDVITEWPETLSTENLVVVCNKIDTKLTDKLSYYTVKIPALSDWQVLDYIKVICPTLSADQRNSLYEQSNKNLYRILNELDKITNFDNVVQPTIFADILNDPNSDLYTEIQQETDLTNKIITGDMSAVLRFFKHRDLFPEFDGMKIALLLLNNYKLALYLKYNRMSAADLKLSSGRAWHIQQDNARYTEAQLKEKIKFLSNIDLLLKTNKLQLSKTALVDYVVCGVI